MSFFLILIAFANFNALCADSSSREDVDSPAFPDNSKTWTCIHDQLKQPKLMYVVEPPSVDRAARSAEAEYGSIRIHVEYDHSMNNALLGRRIMTKIMPEVTEFFQGALTVKRMTSPILLSRPCLFDDDLYIQLDPYPVCPYGCDPSVKCGEVIVPSNHLAACRTKCDTNYANCEITGSEGSGVPNADFLLYVSAVDSGYCEKYKTTLAYSSFCGLEPTLDRPVVGYVNFCPLSSIIGADDDIFITLAKHEVTHALVFSRTLFPFWRYPSGSPRTQRDVNSLPPRDSKTKFFNASSTTVRKDIKHWDTYGGKHPQRKTISLVTSKIVEATKAHYGCSSATGLELDFQRVYNNTVPSHWDKKLVENEVMSPTLSKNSVFSSLTFAAFEDSGWYKVNYSYAQPFRYGQELGCDFMEKSCYTWMKNQRMNGYSLAPYCIADVDTDRPLDCTFDRQCVAKCAIRRYEKVMPDVWRYFRDPNIGGPASTQFCPILLDRGLVDQFIGTGFYSYSYHDGQCKKSTNQPTDSSNELAELYGPNSKCVNHGTEKWQINGQEVQDSGAGCYEYKCTPLGILVRILGIEFNCSCEGIEFRFNLTFPRSSYNIKGSILCPSCKDLCWDQPNSSCSPAGPSCSGTYSYSTECSSDINTFCRNAQVTTPCNMFPCDNGGNCVNDDETYWCNCQDGYSGQNCTESQGSFQFPAAAIITIVVGDGLIIAALSVAVAYCSYKLKRSSKYSVNGDEEDVVPINPQDTDTED